MLWIASVSLVVTLTLGQGLTQFVVLAGRRCLCFGIADDRPHSVPHPADLCRYSMVGGVAFLTSLSSLSFNGASLWRLPTFSKTLRTLPNDRFWATLFAAEPAGAVPPG